MKWAHQGILRIRSMEQSKGGLWVYEREAMCVVCAHSDVFIYLGAPEDKKVE